MSVVSVILFKLKNLFANGIDSSFDSSVIMLSIGCSGGPDRENPYHM